MNPTPNARTPPPGNGNRLRNLSRMAIAQIVITTVALFGLAAILYQLGDRIGLVRAHVSLEAHGMELITTLLCTIPGQPPKCAIITTTCGEGESAAKCNARHDAKVQAQTEYVESQGGTCEPKDN